MATISSIIFVICMGWTGDVGRLERVFGNLSAAENYIHRQEYLSMWQAGWEQDSYVILKLEAGELRRYRPEYLKWEELKGNSCHDKYYITRCSAELEKRGINADEYIRNLKGYGLPSVF